MAGYYVLMARRAVYEMTTDLYTLQGITACTLSEYTGTRKARSYPGGTARKIAVIPVSYTRYETLAVPCLPSRGRGTAGHSRILYMGR